MNSDLAQQYLSRDYLLHVDMLECIRRGNADLRFASEQGVLLFDTGGEVFLMSANDKPTANQMIDLMRDPEMITAHQDFYIPTLLASYPRLSIFMECYNAAYLEPQPMPEPAGRCVIQPLDASHIDFVQQHYTNKLEREYILERLQSGAIIGAYVDGQLAGFAGSHIEGSIGMVEVLPEYRRRGIAEVLEARIANQMLTLGYVPYAQIVVSNQPSLALQQKLNFTISEHKLWWLL